MITIGSGGKRIDRPYETEIQPSANVGKNYGGIVQGLRTIKEKYETSLREKAREYGRSNVEEKTFDSDEDLTIRAARETDAKYAPKRDKAELTLEDALASARKEKKGLGTSYAEDVSSIREKESRSLSSLKESAARRGMTDSSVTKLQAESIAESAASAVANAGKHYADRVNELNDKIRRAKQTYDDAMRGYEISYAIELEKKMEKYRAQRDKLLAEYEKEASSEAEKRANEYLRENEAFNTEYEAANGDYVGEKRENYRERYDYVVSEMRDMTAAEKEGFLRQYGEELEDYLGLYYRKLIRG